MGDLVRDTRLDEKVVVFIAVLVQSQADSRRPKHPPSLQTRHKDARHNA